MVKPLFFISNRVWRCYTGGLLIDKMKGAPEPIDSHLPEEWLASTTRALNGPNQQSPDEGLSRLKNPDGTAGDLLINARPGKPEVLCKFLDSSVRLPIQCHPDRPFARRHYNSDHGKEESWFILGTRPINGIEPYLLAGFKPGVDKKAFIDAVKSQDIKTMEGALHRIPVKPGDAFFIPGRFPHAIGPGVFMLEVQEPTDWVVQPERFIGDTELTHSDMWGPLDPDLALECFDYDSAATLEETLKRIVITPKISAFPAKAGIHSCQEPGSPPARGGQDETVKSDSVNQSALESLIGPERTDSFSVDRLSISGAVDFPCKRPWHIAIFTSGSGTLRTEGFQSIVHQGDCVFLPEGLSSVRYESTEGMTVYLVSA
jgi:mannose-6-phosphate isomerase